MSEQQNAQKGERAQKAFPNNTRRFDLLRLQPLLRELAALAGIGAQKYAARNWELGLPYSEYYNALTSHLLRWWEDGDDDLENGVNHLVSVAWYCMALRWFQTSGVGQDDRPHKEQRPTTAGVNDSDTTRSKIAAVMTAIYAEKKKTGETMPEGLTTPSFGGFQAACRETAQGNGGQVLYLATGLAGECGEAYEAVKAAELMRTCCGVCEVAKKLTRGSKPYAEAKAEVLSELGDVLWYVAELATAFGFSLSDVMAMNMKKLADRVSKGTLLNRSSSGEADHSERG